MSMNKCPSGLHFYDDEKYTQCPYCLKNAETGIEDVNEMLTEFKNVEIGEMLTEKNEDSSLLNSYRLIADSLKEGIEIDDVDSDLTIGVYSEEKGNKLLVGWLVCILGAEKGRDYRLFHGVNRMGQGRGCEIEIVDDPEMSSEQLRIVYDGKGACFYVVPTDGNLTYLNGQVLKEAKPIFKGDKLSTGSSVFVFVPFLDNGKTWDDFEKECKNEEV